MVIAYFGVTFSRLKFTALHFILLYGIAGRERVFNILGCDKEGKIIPLGFALLILYFTKVKM